jgi:hypothetical protein
MMKPWTIWGGMMVRVLMAKLFSCAENNTPVPSSPETFSQFKDKVGYNGRVLSKYRVDCMVMSVFNHRSALQELKMRSLTATILKIDFNYKLARKIRVWTKQGQSFSPYKWLVTVHNEDGLTVFWKALKHSESFSEIEQDVIRLCNRLNWNRVAQHAASVARNRVQAEENEDEMSCSSGDTEFDATLQAVRVVYWITVAT